MTLKMHHRLLILILPAALVLLIQGVASAQTGTSAKGKLEVICDNRVDVLISKHIQINESRKGIDGYRIQLFFDSGTNSKTRAQAIYASFMARYPNVGAYLTFKSPNYKVRVGDFRTRLDAQRFLNEILPDYPNAWVTQDDINLPKVD